MDNLRTLRLPIRAFSSFAWTASARAAAGAAFLAALSGALAAAPEAAPHAASKLPGYEVAALGRGNYNRLNLVVTVEGTKGRLILDTGAAGTVLSSGKFGFLLHGDNRKLPDNLPAKSHVNDLSAPVALAHDVQLGAIKIDSFPLRIVGPKYFHDAQMLYSQSDNYDYDGILGEEVLRHFNAIVDCGRMILYLNTDPSKKAKLEGALTAAGWTRVPMAEAGPHLVVPCTLGGRQFNFLVDTGAPFTHLDLGLVHDAQVQTKELGVSGGLIGSRVPVRADLVMPDSVRIGDFTARNVHMLASQGLSEYFAETQKRTTGGPLLGLLGGDILGRNNAIIDLGGHSLYLKSPGQGGSKTP